MTKVSKSQRLIQIALTTMLLTYGLDSTAPNAIHLTAATKTARTLGGMMTDCGGGRLRLLDGAWLLFGIIASSIWCVSASAPLGAAFRRADLHHARSGKLANGQLKASARSRHHAPAPSRADAPAVHLGALARRDVRSGPGPRPSCCRSRGWARCPSGGCCCCTVGWRAGRWRCLGRPIGRCLSRLRAEPARPCQPGDYRCRRDGMPARPAVPLSSGKGPDRGGASSCLPLWFALAVLAKASGLVFGIIGLSMVELEHQWAARTESTEGRSSVFGSAMAALFSKPFRRDLIRDLHLGLVGGLLFLRLGRSALAVFHRLGRPAARRPHAFHNEWIAEHLCIFSNAGVALVRQFRHNVQGHGVFLLEQVEKRAIWYYFPLASEHQVSSTPSCSPLLLAAVCRRPCGTGPLSRPSPSCCSRLVCRVQTGIRLVLPWWALPRLASRRHWLWPATARSDTSSERFLLTASCVSSARHGSCGLALGLASWLVLHQRIVGRHGQWLSLPERFQLRLGPGIERVGSVAAASMSVAISDVMYYGTDTNLAVLPMQAYLPGMPCTLDPTILPCRRAGSHACRGHLHLLRQRQSKSFEFEGLVQVPAR